MALGSHQRPGLPWPPPRGHVACKTEPEGPLRSPPGCPGRRPAPWGLAGPLGHPEGLCSVSAPPPGVLEAPSHCPCKRPLVPGPHRRPARAGRDGGRGLGGCRRALSLPVCLEWWTGAACCPLGGQRWGRNAPGCGCFPGVPVSARYTGAIQAREVSNPSHLRARPRAVCARYWVPLRTRHGRGLL